MAAAEREAWSANGKMFSTPDSDNDILEPGNCATTHRSGWWFGQCTTNFVNYVGNAIWTTGTPVYDVQASHMLVKIN